MKKIYCLIAAIFSASIISAEEPQEMQVHGPVKSISNETYGFSMKFGELVQDEIASVGPTYYLNNYGKVMVVDNHELNWKGEKLFDKYTYDSDGRISEITKPGKQSMWRCTYVYGDQGIKEINEYNDYGLTYKTKFYYKDGIKSSIKYNGNGEPDGHWGKSIYLYDKQKYPKEEYQGYGVIRSYENNKIVQEQIDGIMGYGGAVITYQYNSHGYLEKEITKTVLNVNKTYSYKYDEYGNWVECKIQQDKETLYGIETTYTLQKRKIEYADTKDFIFEDPELIELARRKHIQDSIESEVKLRQAEEKRLIEEKAIRDAIEKAKKDSLLRIEQAHRDSIKYFKQNVEWCSRGVSGFINAISIDKNGKLDVMQKDILPAQYFIYENSPQNQTYRCYLNKETDNCVVLVYDRDGNLSEIFLITKAHTRNGGKNYQFEKRVIKKLEKYFINN